MKKLFTSTALATMLGFTSFIAVPAFADTTAMTPAENFNQAVATWTPVSNAKCYNIYYRRTTQTTWKHSVRCLPSNMWTYTVKYLKQNVSYVYSVSAVNFAGKEISWSPVAPLVVSPMVK